MRLLFIGALLFAALAYCADQDVLTILNQQTGISRFISQLQKYPDLIDLLNGGTYTVLAPNDEAFSDFAAQNPSSANDSDFMEALIRYHIAHNTHPSAEFGLNPLFPSTLLNSTKYANVTGGQRVELMLQDNTPTILSGVKAASHLVTPDVFFQGGLIHIISSVLTIPISFPSTITRAKLTNLVTLLNKGGWLNPSSPAISIANDLSDLTVFGPDSPQFGAGFTGFDSLSESDLDAIFRYSVVQESPPLYSSELRNASRHSTLQNGTSILITAGPDNSFYADAALITTTDYLVSNGVLQVISAPLNPLTSGIGPDLTSTNPPPSPSTRLSSAALAGLIIGLLSALLGLGLILALIIRNRKRRGLPLLGTIKRQRMPEENTPGIPRHTPSTRLASANTNTNANDHGDPSGLELANHPSALPPRYGTHELDNKHYPSPPSTSAQHDQQQQLDQQQRGIGTVSVVEIHNHPYYPPSSTHASHVPSSNMSSTNSNTNSTDQRALYPLTRAVDANGRTVTVYGGDGKPLPPKPPSPQEIDGHEFLRGGGGRRRGGSGSVVGRERGRISISITGEAPRHLGFQARY